MGAVLGMILGLGVALSFWSLSDDPSRRPRSRGGLPPRVLGDAAATVGLRPGALLALCGACGVLVVLIVGDVSRSPSIGLVFGSAACWLPYGWARSHSLRVVESRRDAWPDVVDDLTSAVRAGLALPEALAQLADRGSEQLRPPFARFGQEYRATGRFGPSLDVLKSELADPVGDRVVESLRIAREVGGSDLGRLLRTLSQFLREDARTRGELQSRQAWTVNGARLAVGAPWAILGLLATRPQAVAAYDSAPGALVLGIGAVVSVAAYRLMLRIGRLPVEARVLT
jgi:tight adherence protein B